MGKRKRKLTDEEWRQVFAIRCRSKEGRPISKEERSLCDAAFKSDESRYGEMEADVFNATVPFGSNVRWRK